MKLYPYQVKAVKKIRVLLSAGERPLCYAPTGGGKTQIAGQIFARSTAAMKVFVVHTDQLRVQARDVLKPHGVIVTTIQGMLANPDIFREAGLVCFDECHHLQGQKWREAAALFAPECAIFGLSATPFACALDELFTCRYTIARVEELIDGGYILPVGIIRPCDMFIEKLGESDRVDGALAYCAAGRGQPAVHFEPTIELCERALAQYQSKGVAAAVVTGETPRAERDQQIDLFRAGKVRVLISAVLLGEGFDAPCAAVLVAGRAFSSDVLLQQAVGRIRRTHPGKTQGWILDCTGCCNAQQPAYFNQTDEALFSSLPDSEARATGGGIGKHRLQAETINWVECPEDQWVAESAIGIRDALGHIETADMVEAIEKLVDERKLERQREAVRRSLAKARANPQKAEKLREHARRAQAKRMADSQKAEKQREQNRRAKAKRMADPQKVEVMREQKRRAYAKIKADPQKAEKFRERRRLSHAKMMADPQKAEKRREYQRRNDAKKKALKAAES